MRWVLLAAMMFLGSNHAFADDLCSLEQPCLIDGGDYYLAIPEDWDRVEKRPAILFFHGHNSSAKSVIKSAGIKRAFLDQGYVIIAPNGVKRPGDNVRAWPARPMGAEWRDDLAFTLAVINDVTEKLPIDSEKILISGFSAGGSMAWMVACYEGQQFSGFVSVAGALRRPIPDETCPAGPVRMLHIHGFGDRQVPLEGRAIGNWHQGDVHQSLDLLRKTNQCASTPSAIVLDKPYRCRIWSDCEGGAAIELCMHDGGHGLPNGWAEKARAWFEKGQNEKGPSTQ